MSDVQQGGGCACCGTAADSINTDNVADSAVRARFVVGAEQLGINGQDLTEQAAAVQAAPRLPAARRAMSAAALDGGARPDLVCTLDGGLDAMRGRIDQWRAVIARATAQEPADGGVTLVYDHDPETTVELARLAAAEFACCAFFTFALTREQPRSLVDTGSVALVEALPAAARDAEHFPGAVDVPGDLTADLAVRLGPDLSAIVVVYCSGPGCGRSGVTAAAFERFGYADVRVYLGGKLDWLEAGRPLAGTRAGTGTSTAAR